MWLAVGAKLIIAEGRRLSQNPDYTTLLRDGFECRPGARPCTTVHLCFTEAAEDPAYGAATSSGARASQARFPVLQTSAKDMIHHNVYMCMCIYIYIHTPSCDLEGRFGP